MLWGSRANVHVELNGEASSTLCKVFQDDVELIYDELNVKNWKQYLWRELSAELGNIR